MLPYLYERFGNPSSSHPYGVVARAAVERARAEMAELLRATPSEIVFTGGGTEANNLAIQGVARAYGDQGNHIITSAIEHPAVTEVCDWLAAEGHRVTVLSVDRDGLVDPADLEAALADDTILVSIMHANNEVGTIEPIQALAEIAHRRGILFHTDAAQSVGKIPVYVDELGVDLLSVAGHKLYAPKGVGALYIRDGVRLERVLFGAGQEGGRRPGTENVLEIVGLGAAAQVAARDLVANEAHYRAMRDRLWQGLGAALGKGSLRLNGHPERRLPNTLNVSFHDVEADALLGAIDDHVAASAGAACHADLVRISPVLEAMQVAIEWAKGAVRFSTGRGSNAEDIDRAVAVVSDAVRRLRQG
jgi:cysteine desulfurase